jgi:hypothetical protein
MSIIDGQVTVHALALDEKGRVSSTSPEEGQQGHEELSAALEAVNSLARSLAADAFPDGIPPPPQPAPNKRSNQVAKAKEEGNTAFKKGM